MEVCPVGAIRVRSICRGVLPRTLANWVSVSIFIGIRFRSRICSGRISWVIARVSVMKKMFSFSSVFAAGSLFGILMGM